ncbi:Uncharacterised protein [Bartonella vinsonii]|uniref:Uncharacterized protein n=1 Tax=Bartonella vinsonii TaxID=33047 RepID=A0A448V4H6_BARVI|nr:Uncharacterised protein [Bartonella vinsonii]
MINGFQEIHALKIGELWALPSVIQMLLIENVCRFSLRIEQTRSMRHLAHKVADKISLADNETKLHTFLRTINRSLLLQPFQRIYSIVYMAHLSIQQPH